MKEGNILKSKDINFEYIEEFVDYLIEKLEDNDELFATVVCKFEEAKDIIKHLMMYEDTDFENIYLESSDERGYEDEFCIELWYNDGVINFSCDPLKVDEKYGNPCGDETYLLENCSSKIIPLCEGSDLYFVSLEDECDCDEECDECRCNCHCGDTAVANTESASYKINDKPVTKEEFDKKYKELHEICERNMVGIFNDYCSFMDEFNTFFSRLW